MLNLILKQIAKDEAQQATQPKTITTQAEFDQAVIEFEGREMGMTDSQIARTKAEFLRTSLMTDEDISTGLPAPKSEHQQAIDALFN